MFQLLQFAVVAIAILLGVARYPKNGIKKTVVTVVTILCSACVSFYMMQYDIFNTIPIDARRLLIYYYKLLIFFAWAICFVLVESFLLWCMNEKNRGRFRFQWLVYLGILLLSLYGALSATHDSIFGIYSIYLYRVTFFVIAIAGASYFFAKDSSDVEREGDV